MGLHLNNCYALIFIINSFFKGETGENMPYGDGSGPQGQGRGTGRGQRTGVGQSGRGRNNGPLAAGPTGACKCPNCGYTQQHVRGQICTSIKCPKCGAFLVRE